MISVALVATDGALASGLHGFLDAFFTANYILRKKEWGIRNAEQFEAKIVSAGGGPVLALNGRKIETEGSIHDIGDPQIIVIGAIIGAFRSEQAVRTQLAELASLKTWLNEQYVQGAFLASGCTGAFLLAEAGLLDGKLATTHWRLAPMLKLMYPKVKVRATEILVENDRILCAGGALSSLQLSLKIIEKYAGRETAIGCAKLLVTDPSKDSQTPYRMFFAPTKHGDKLILEAQEWLEKNYANPVSIEALAQLIGLGDRNFKRRFKSATGETPLSYLQHVRINHAKSKLEMTREQSNQIIWSVGYEDLSSFRRLFKREVGMTMEDYRKRFGLAVLTGGTPLNRS